jgi:hypothetical protein
LLAVTHDMHELHLQHRICNIGSWGVYLTRLVWSRLVSTRVYSSRLDSTSLVSSCVVSSSELGPALDDDTPNPGSALCAPPSLVSTLRSRRHTRLSGTLLPWLRGSVAHNIARIDRIRRVVRIAPRAPHLSPPHPSTRPITPSHTVSIDLCITAPTPGFFAHTSAHAGASTAPSAAPPNTCCGV